MKMGASIFFTDYAMAPGDLAVALEQRGFESLWVAERDTIQTAKSVASLDRISRGRFLFGIGCGWNAEEMEEHGVAFETRTLKMREQIEAMREIWTKPKPEYHGEIIDFPPMETWPKPVQDRLPVIVGGMFRFAARRAIRYGDGILPAAPAAGSGSPEEFMPGSARWPRRPAVTPCRSRCLSATPGRSRPATTQSRSSHLVSRADHHHRQRKKARRKAIIMLFFRIGTIPPQHQLLGIAAKVAVSTLGPTSPIRSLPTPTWSLASISAMRAMPFAVAARSGNTDCRGGMPPTPSV